MMLTELHIQNFRIFDDFEISGLKRVNLIAGKNNTGKTTLLEAIRIYAAKDYSSVVNHILKQRGQFVPDRDSIYEHLFHNNNNKTYKSLLINDLSIRHKSESHAGFPKSDTAYHLFNIANNKNTAPIHLSRLYANKTADYPDDGLVYVPFGNYTQSIQELWDKIVLTDLEDYVLRIIQTAIDPRILRIDVKENNTKVRLKDVSAPVPLQTLGDGVIRILHLALAIVNAKNSILLIDELEAGLHHSVQEKLWELLFEYCQKWNIQAFITTHSEDTLRTFSYIATRPENETMGFFFRMQTIRDGKLEAIAYDMERLQSALEIPIEIR